GTLVTGSSPHPRGDLVSGKRHFDLISPLVRGYRANCRTGHRVVKSMSLHELGGRHESRTRASGMRRFGRWLGRAVARAGAGQGTGQGARVEVLRGVPGKPAPGEGL